MISIEQTQRDWNAKLYWLPATLRRFIVTHHELVKFAIVGFTTMLVDLVVFYGLTLTLLGHKPAVSKIIAGVVAMCVSYVLNSKWSFKNRGGHTRHQEAVLFFAISTVGVGIGAAPEFVVSNLTTWRDGSTNLLKIIALDFCLNYIIGNLAQMIFRFWALRKFAFPEVDTGLTHSSHTDAPEEISPTLPPAHHNNLQAQPTTKAPRNSWFFGKRQRA